MYLDLETVGKAFIDPHDAETTRLAEGQTMGTISALTCPFHLLVGSLRRAGSAGQSPCHETWTDPGISGSEQSTQEQKASYWRVRPKNASTLRPLDRMRLRKVPLATSR